MFCDGRDVPALPDGDSEAITLVNVQHNGNVGTAVTQMNDAFRSHLKRSLQIVARRHFAISGIEADNGLDFARSCVLQLRTVDVVRGDNILKRRLNHFLRRGGDNVKVEAKTGDSTRKKFGEAADVVLEPYSLSRLYQMRLENSLPVFRIVQ